MSQFILVLIFTPAAFQCGFSVNETFNEERTLFPAEYGGLYRVDQVACLNPSPSMITDPSTFTRFWLYTRNNKDMYEELYINRRNSTNFVSGQPVVMVTHGWTGSGHSDSVQYLKNEYLSRFHVNVIVVNWRSAANRIYCLSSFMTKFVGEDVSDMVLTLIKQFDFDVNDLHLIGHSLGAHVMGRAGHYLKSHQVIVPRVTGLDPARPLFEFPRIFPPLSKRDAAFVDVIHTNIGEFGFMSAIGHADFYPNGGIRQNYDCTPYIIPRVNDHNCAFMLYKQSISHNLVAFRCNSYEDFQKDHCDDVQIMGMPCSSAASGKYYLDID